ncbi:MAG: hypothetical protein GY810_16880 [Aureispira sp.]|nr:hypothetical protein [Aureispira sp.]
MKINVLKNCLALFICFGIGSLSSCSQAESNLENSKLDALDTLVIELETWWDTIPKQMIGLDSIELKDILLRSLDSRLIFVNQYKWIKGISVTKIDLDDIPPAEYIIELENLEYTTYVFRLNDLDRIELIWETYEEHYTPVHRVQMPFKWLVTSQYTPCSHCSYSTNSYYKVFSDTVIPVLCNAFSYDYDTDVQDSFGVYERADGHMELVDSTISITYDIQWSMDYNKFYFINDSTVQVIYEWDEQGDSLFIKETYPKGLKSYILKRIDKENYRALGNNNIVYAGYRELKQQDLINLKTKQVYQKTIELWELNYGYCWDSIVLNWEVKHSHLEF